MMRVRRIGCGVAVAAAVGGLYATGGFGVIAEQLVPTPHVTAAEVQDKLAFHLELSNDVPGPLAAECKPDAREGEWLCGVQGPTGTDRVAFSVVVDLQGKLLQVYKPKTSKIKTLTPDQARAEVVAAAG